MSADRPALLRLPCGRAASIRRALPLVASLVVLAGCSDPKFAGDADGGADDAEVTAPETPEQDAGAPADLPVSKFPAWASQLKGLYAVQAFTFAKDSYTTARTTDLWIVKISEEAEGYEARIQVCQEIAVNDFGTVMVVGADKLPERRHRIVFGADSFDSEPLDVGVGYDDHAPEGCTGKPGGEIPKLPFQTWLSGATCVCGTTPVPSREDDCRITDPDGDEAPGFTIEVTVPLGNIKYWPYGIAASRTGFLQGHVTQGGRHTALLASREETVQLGSSGAKFTVPERSPPCPVETSRASFVPLEPMVSGMAWTCGALLVREKELFPMPAPTRKCPR